MPLNCEYQVTVSQNLTLRLTCEFATSPSRCAEKNAPIKLSTIPWILPDVTTLFFSMINVNDMISLKQENNLIAVSVSFFLPMIYIKGGKLATALR